jgi:predicted Rossmann fold flavoprotein
MDSLPLSADVAIVGGGAAGLAAAVFTRRDHPDLHVVLLDAAAKPGAKILVSGGGRCNVTNTIVREADFWGGKRTIVRRVLNALPVPETVAFFEGLGVQLHEEAGGKLFPDSNRARDVLNALLRGVGASGATLLSGVRVNGIERRTDAFALHTSAGTMTSRAVVLATGGRSLPKTGSDGGGYQLARGLGHTLVPQTPALAPLVLDPQSAYGVHAALSGVAHDVELAVWVGGAVTARLSGALLWTHFGVSGPVVLNASRHWARARLAGEPVRITLNVQPGAGFDAIDARLLTSATARPRGTLRALLGESLPGAVAQAMLGVLQLAPDRSLSALSREDRRRLVHALTEWPLPVLETRGYNYAEVTAGGVELTEIDPATMESRLTPGLFLIGEILDVDGRIGGFNFQWAWASARTAARGIGRAWDRGGRIRTAAGP